MSDPALPLTSSETRMACHLQSVMEDLLKEVATDQRITILRPSIGEIQIIMPPVINLTQSLLAYDQYQTWSYQPWATGLDGSTNPQWATEANLRRVLPGATVATTSALASSTYNNGVDGVGATLTASANGALTVDTVVLIVGDKVLVKNESLAFRNGLYVVTDAGSVSTPWALTRHESMDTAAEVKGVVEVYLGLTNAKKIFVCPPEISVMGTSAITMMEWKNRWDSTPLPNGMKMNPATGEITGAASVAGVWVAGIRASSDSGATWSAPVNVCIGIDSSYSDDEDEAPPVDLEVDLTTGEVSMLGDALHIARNDQRLIRVGFVESGKRRDIGALSSLKIAVKQYEPEELVYVGGGHTGDGETPPNFGSSGEGASRVYLFFANIGSDIDSILGEYEEDGGTTAPILAELEWKRTNPTNPQIGPSELVQSSLQFPLAVRRDFLKN